VAASVFKVKPEEVTPEMRRKAKVINFGIIYGMGVLALRQNLGTSREEAQNFLNDYFATFSTLAAYLDRIKAETARKGYTETFFGRRRYFEGIKSKIPYVRASAERMAINAPIQGTEADIIKLAMIKVDEYIRREKLENNVFPLLQVHDELVYEIRADGKEKVPPEKVVAEIEKIMQSVMDLKDTKGVALASHASIGNNWGELK
jgi:DNA polymerase-1